MRESTENKGRTRGLPQIGVNSPQDSLRQDQHNTTSKDEIVQKLRAISKQNNSGSYNKMKAVYTKAVDVPRGRKLSNGEKAFESTKATTVKLSRPSETKISPVTTA